MSTVTDWLAKQTTYTDDDAGRLTKTQYPNTVWTDYTYDSADRLASVVNKKTGPVTISSFTYTMDAVGNRAQMVHLSGTHSYQYDALHQLKQVTYPGPQTDAYTYDANGNRLTKNATNYTNNAADQLTCSWSGPPTPACPAGSLNYGYDNNGNQTSRGTDMFTYDHENQLTQSVISGVTSSSVYNGDGLRMSHTVSGQTTNYTWDAAAGLPVVLQDGTNTYVYGLDLISATDGAGAQTYFLYDGLGSTVGLTDSLGNNPVSYGYDVFGSIRTQTGTSSNHWLFTGEQRDGDSSLYYLRARYYDPTTGRFLSMDPLGEGNGYSYVFNNPVNLIDPYGLHICDYAPIFEEECREAADQVEAGANAVGGLIDEAEQQGRAALDFAQDAWEAAQEAALATARFLGRFGTMNCLSAGLGILAFAAGFAALTLFPPGALIAGSGQVAGFLSLYFAGVGLYVASAAVNGAQINDAGGGRSQTANAVTLGADLAAGTATLAAVSPYGALALGGAATLANIVQCYGDVRG